MTVLYEGMHNFEFIVSEGDKTYSREEVVVDASQTLKPGHVLGRITSSGRYVEHDAGASNGAQNAAAILCNGAVTAAGETVKRTAVVRRAEVNGGELTFKAGISAANRTAAIASLAAVGIIVR